MTAEEQLEHAANVVIVGQQRIAQSKPSAG
jgi:hypothetical protein